MQEHCVLAWNLVGTVILRRQVRFTSIDVDFQDKSMHRNFSLNDDFNCSMASLNYSGLMTASQGETHDLDKYEEDEDDDQEMNQNQGESTEKIDKKASYLYYKPLNERKNLKDWHFKMNFNERIECIA